MVEIIPKQELASKREKLPLFVACILLVAVLAGLFAFWQLKTNTQKTIVKLEEFLQRGKTAKEQQLEQKMLMYQKKLSDFDTFAQSRKNPLRFFQFLEQNTHPKVFFTNTTLDVPNRSLLVQGETLDFITLDQQLSLFKQKSEIESVQLSKLDIGQQGRVTFTLELTFSPKIFQ